MNITDLRARLETLYDTAQLTHQPSELTGALSGALRVARQVEARANCAHQNQTGETKVHGRRVHIVTCNTCNTILSCEDV